ncbi:uncharacterized protein RHO25_007174 [Cercospora beticola]|uniref:Uncharacterized protein n=1 Tax=Cercospora beticola TaxID=122368 RepID=A0ABZ0NSH5_CERBT|nr:hypothetical protein RHO25_007174 [Cercospora beticola]
MLERHRSAPNFPILLSLTRGTPENPAQRAIAGPQAYSCSAEWSDEVHSIAAAIGGPDAFSAAHELDMSAMSPLPISTPTTNRVEYTARDHAIERRTILFHPI